MTAEPENLRRRAFTEVDDESRGEELTLSFLDHDAPGRLVGCLDHDLACASHWYVPYAEIAAFPGQATAPG